MARKTFISYKYSESQQLRDKIIESLGDDAQYYNGETSDSPDVSDRKTETIKERLKDMIYDTSVMIVIFSPNMLLSEWISWEISYALKSIKRNVKTSKPNRIIAVIKKENGNYMWLKEVTKRNCGCVVTAYNSWKIPEIIKENRYNLKNKEYSCDECKTYDWWNDSYISIVEEDEFLENISYYIEKTFEKNSDNYNLKRKL